MSIILLLIAGALGALVKDILEDNEIVLPKKVNGKLALGSLGGMCIGGIAGYFIDGTPTTAFLAGYTGKAMIENLVAPKVLGTKVNETMEEIIEWVAKEESVDPDLALRVAKCENPKLDPKAVNINTDGSRDRGLFQINDKYHSDVTDDQAFDPVFSARFFCKAFKAGNLKWWDATKDCWSK